MVDSSQQDEQWRLSDSNCQSDFILSSISTLLQVDCCTCTRLIRRSYRMNVCVGVEWFICVPPVAVWLWSSVWQFWHRYFTIFGEGAYYGSSLDLNMRSVTCPWVWQTISRHLTRLSEEAFSDYCKNDLHITSMSKLSYTTTYDHPGPVLSSSATARSPTFQFLAAPQAARRCSTGGNHMAPGKQ